jgi:effector-binding domain-containing protein
MNRMRKILYTLGAIVLLIAAVGVFLPATAHVERESLVDAYPATVFVLISDIHRTADWSPWIEPWSDTRLATGGPVAGVDAGIEWQGDGTEGSRLIVESVPHERVVARLELDGVSALSTLTLRQADGTTAVRWELDIDFGNDLARRYGGLFLEGRLGGRLDAGLASLKTLAENLPRADFSDLQIETMEVEPVPIAYRTTSSRPDATAVSDAMGEAYFEILAFMDRNGLEEAGPPLSITRTFSGAELVFDAAIPVAGVTGQIPQSGSGVQLGTTYGGQVVRATHTGSYRNLAVTHRKLAAWLAAHGIERNGDAWETYVSDPARIAEEELVTQVYYPVKGRGEKEGTAEPRAAVPSPGEPGAVIHATGDIGRRGLLSRTSPGTVARPAVRRAAAASGAARNRSRAPGSIP